MGLQKCGLKLNHTGKELQINGTLGFPCAGFSEQYTDKPKDIIPWHWHVEFEIVHVKKGALKLQIPAKSFYLERGDCFVINSNVFHYVIASLTAELQSLVFDPVMVTGNNESVFAQKYILPLISCSAFSGYFIKDFTHDRMVNDFVEALALDNPGFEFSVRNMLSDICFFYTGNLNQK